MHFLDQKVHEITLDFRDSFQKPSEGQVLLRIQYIHDEELLLEKLQEREQLILKWLDILDDQKLKMLSKGFNFRDTVGFLGSQRSDTVALGAGYYRSTTEDNNSEYFQNGVNTDSEYQDLEVEYSKNNDTDEEKQSNDSKLKQSHHHKSDDLEYEDVMAKWISGVTRKSKTILRLNLYRYPNFHLWAWKHDTAH